MGMLRNAWANLENTAKVEFYNRYVLAAISLFAVEIDHGFKYSKGSNFS